MSTGQNKDSIYSSVSADSQTDGESLEQQLEQNRNPAKEKGLEIVDVSIDEAASDTTR